MPGKVDPVVADLAHGVGAGDAEFVRCPSLDEQPPLVGVVADAACDRLGQHHGRDGLVAGQYPARQPGHGTAVPVVTARLSGQQVMINGNALAVQGMNHRLARSVAERGLMA